MLFDIKKHKIKLQLKNLTLIKKYALISVISYVYIFFSLFLLIDIFNFNKRISFIVIYGLAYIFLYIAQLRFLFNKKHHKSKFYKYIFSILLFYIFANLFFNLGLYFKLNYLLATVVTVIILMPIRFLVYKNYVYMD